MKKKEKIEFISIKEMFNRLLGKRLSLTKKIELRKNKLDSL